MKLFGLLWIIVTFPFLAIAHSFGETTARCFVEIEDKSVLECFKFSSTFRACALSCKHLVIGLVKLVLDVAFGIISLTTLSVVLIYNSGLSYVVMLKKDGVLENLGNLRDSNTESAALRYHSRNEGERQRLLDLYRVFLRRDTLGVGTLPFEVVNRLLKDYFRCQLLEAALPCTHPCNTLKDSHCIQNHQPVSCDQGRHQAQAKLQNRRR